jgi:head-tail adaptor
MSIRAKLRAQSLDDLVSIERNAPTSTGRGGLTPNWYTVVRNVAARVDGAKASGPEQVADGGIRTLRDYTVWIRADVYKRFSITPLDRVNWHGRLMSIRDVPDQGLRGQVIAVICSAGLSKE